VVTAAVTAAVLALAARPASAKTYTVGREQNKGQIRLNIGDTLLVRLPATSDVSYSWFVGQNNPDVLRFLGHVTDRRGGTPGTQLLTFRAVASGGVGLTLSYRKPAMLGAEAPERYRLLVTVGRVAGAGRTVTVDESFNGGRVEVWRGDLLAVRLPASPGYRWALAEGSPLVRPSGVRTEPGTGARRSEVTQVLFFRVLDARGKSGRLTFVYQKTATPGVAAKRFTVVVVAG
jgi:predicted secreted protein